MTAPGTVRVEGGLLADVTPDVDGIKSFKGIPYAAPPLGPLRWRAPQPVPAWTGVRPTDQWGPRCEQNPRLGELDPLNSQMSEDCLYLNVWTGAATPDAALPVMVWIHGGSNSIGAASQPEYDGSPLARKGVLLVSLNYRLDVFGFLAHPELSAESGHGSSGNYGLLDQIAALQWVQRNIARFGGDPARVTVFGESAGAFDISLLMVSPLTQGLFSKVIAQSGGALRVHAQYGPKPLATGEEEGARFAAAVGASSLAQLRSLPAEQLRLAAARAPVFFGAGVVDGYVVPEHPAKLFAEGRHHDLPLLTGINQDEGSLFMAVMKQPGNAAEFVAFMQTQFAERTEQALALYWPSRAEADIAGALCAVIGDQFIGFGNWLWAKAAARHGKAPVFKYLFRRRPPKAPPFSIYPLATPGVYHFAEILYVFNNLELREEWGWTDADAQLADAMSSYWVAFAKTGNPNAPGLTHWQAFDDAESGPLLHLGEKTELAADPFVDRYRLLQQLPG